MSLKSWSNRSRNGNCPPHVLNFGQETIPVRSADAIAMLNFPPKEVVEAGAGGLEQF